MFEGKKKNQKGEPVLGEGTLKKTGKPFELVCLTKADIPEIMELQGKVIGDLTEAEKVFVNEKPKSFFEDHYERGNVVLGIRSEGELIAQAIVLNPSERHPKTGMVDMEPVGTPDSVSVLQGVLVDPEFRGNRLMQEMVAFWLDFADEIGREHVLAEIEVHNHFSWAVFVEEGLAITSIGTDPDDGAKVYNAHETVKGAKAKKLAGDFNGAAKKDSVACHKDNIADQDALMKAGYVCIGYDRKEEIMLMKQAANDAKAAGQKTKKQGPQHLPRSRGA